MLLAGASASAFASADCAPDAKNLYKHQRNGCTDVPWAEAVAAAMPNRPAPVKYVNVGANKGYRVPEFLALWSQQPVPGHMKAWQRRLIDYAHQNHFGYLARYSCGNCKDCEAPPPAAHQRTGARMHLLELASANRALLQHMLEAEKLHDRVTLHQLAASNRSHPMLAFKGLAAGDERGAALVGKKARRFLNASATDTVPAIALDDFFARERLEHVYHVAIDTEGWDALVVEGMRESIRQRRVSILEFEVNNRGMWNRLFSGREARTINGTLNMMHAAGYSCFWVLTHALIPASGACWLEAYGGRPAWSNVLCAHEPPVVAALGRLSREGYAARNARRAAKGPSPST